MARLRPLHMFSFFIQIALLLGFTSVVTATLESQDAAAYFPHQLRAMDHLPSLRYRRSANVSSADLQGARQQLADAVAQQGAYNRYRVANPRRNTYRKRPEGSNVQTRDTNGAPPPPALTPDLLAAAALVAEHEAGQQLANGTLHQSYGDFIGGNGPAPPNAAEFSNSSIHSRADSSYWLSSMAKLGRPPMGTDTSYPVFRDVTDPLFGAKGDGVTDDTKAINAAFRYGNNCAENCLSSSIKGVIVYFPPGTYLISSPINALYYSQMVGDPNDVPIIKTSANFLGLGAIQSDVYIENGNGSEWYVEQSNFFRQIRNLVIDIRSTVTDSAAAIHWQVGQATSVMRVSIAANSASNNTQMGFYTENGSGGFMSDVTIVGGAYGIWGGNQQYTVRKFTIINQFQACIALIWDWGWTWSGLYLSGAPVGISLLDTQTATGGGAAITGSIYVMDSEFFNLGTAIVANFDKSILDSSIINLDNIKIGSTSAAIKYNGGQTLSGVPNGQIDHIVVGNVEYNGLQYGAYTIPGNLGRPSELTTSDQWSQNLYFSKGRPQYETLPTSQIINVQTLGAKGDGVSDDTIHIISAIALGTKNNLVYFPPGSYIITQPVFVPANVRITGTVWSQIVASDQTDSWQDASKPQPMFQVGNKGDTGIVEISDLLFTSKGSNPGLIMVEWNVAASSQGSVGMWDTHFRVGGAYGTKLQLADCPGTSTIQSKCVAANTMLHVTETGNGYFENVWAWVADHDIDDPQNQMITVAVARGMLFDGSPGPNWLYGTASEHAMLYQYNFDKTTNTFAGMIQTESPYFQATANSESPGPFKDNIGHFHGDPDFSKCKGTAEKCSMSWSTMVQGTTNLTIAGAGLYSWFDNYDQACVDTQDCQQRILYDSGDNTRFELWNLVTIGSVEMISGSATILAKPQTQAGGHPYWSAIAGFLDDSSPSILTCDYMDDSPDCAGVKAYSLCDKTKRFNTIADLNKASSSFPAQCMDGYALRTLGTVLNNTLNAYNAANNGYDAVFGYYVKYMKELIPQMISDFMAEPTMSNHAGGAGNAFFDCTYTYGGQTKTQQCPVDFTQFKDLTTTSLTFTLKDANGFYDAISKAYGVDKSWITFGNKRVSTSIPNCNPSPRAPCIYNIRDWINTPEMVKDPTIPNPKDIIAKSLPAFHALQDTITARSMDLGFGTWNGSTSDLIQALSLPVFQYQQAVASMESAKSKGKAEKKEKMIEIITEVLGAVFAVIPFLDDLAPEIGALGGILGGLADVSMVGNAGLAIYDIVRDPKSAPMAILGLLAGGAGRDSSQVRKIAVQRAALKDTDLAKFGTEFKQHEDEFQGTVKRKCRS